MAHKLFEAWYGPIFLGHFTTHAGVHPSRRDKQNMIPAGAKLRTKNVTPRKGETNDQ